jgi:hypothetical protein
MPAKKDAATELAEKMVQVLEAQRHLGTDSYPLTLRRLAELTDPAAPAELVLKAVAKKKPFGERAVAVQPKNLDSPIALSEDADQLASSPLLLAFALDGICSPLKPTCAVSELKKKLPAKLKQLFETAVNRRMEENNLPPGVTVIPVKNKKHLHLLRYPLPKLPEEILAESLVQVLHAQRKLGGDSYPLVLARLVELTQPAADRAVLQKAVTQLVSQKKVLLAVRAVKGDLATPVTLYEDCELLAGSALLLETALWLARSDTNQMFKPTDLARKVVPVLRVPLEQTITQRIRDRSFPSTVGCLFQKNKPLLFLMNDVITTPLGDSKRAERPVPVPRGAPEPAKGSETTSPSPSVVPVPTAAPFADFARDFDAAFQQLDSGRGSHNFVSLLDLRRALPVDRPTFDAELRSLRLAGRYTLSAAEGRFGISSEEQEAGIYEDGSLLLYVSRKL